MLADYSWHCINAANLFTPTYLLASYRSATSEGLLIQLSYELFIQLLQPKPVISNRSIFFSMPLLTQVHTTTNKSLPR